jgi:hypothetical protein
VSRKAFYNKGNEKYEMRECNVSMPVLLVALVLFYGTNNMYGTVEQQEGKPHATAKARQRYHLIKSKKNQFQ